MARESLCASLTQSITSIRATFALTRRTHVLASSSLLIIDFLVAASTLFFDYWTNGDPDPKPSVRAIPCTQTRGILMPDTIEDGAKMVAVRVDTKANYFARFPTLRSSLPREAAKKLIEGDQE